MVAARQGATVVSVDDNPVAVEATQLNAARNHLNITAFRSNLFTAIDGASRFDYILWNPPFFPREPRNDSEKAWYAGDGYGALSEFARQARSFVCLDGRIILILSSQCAVEEILRFFENNGFQIVETATHRSFFENFLIYEIRPRNTSQ